MIMHHAIRQARLDQGLSQVQLAKLAGVTRESVRSLEGGENVTIETVEKVITHLPKLTELTLGGVRVKLTGIDVDAIRAAIVAADAANRYLLALLDASRTSLIDAGTDAALPQLTRADLENRINSLERQVHAIQAGRRDDS